MSRFSAAIVRNAVADHLPHALVLLSFVLVGCRNPETLSKGATLHREAQIWQPWVTYLSGEQYSRLHVEIDYVQGCKPRPQTLVELRKFLQENLDKPDGIVIVVDPPITKVTARASHPRLLALRSIDGPPNHSDTDPTAYLHVLFYDSTIFDEEPTTKLQPHVRLIPYPASVYIDKDYWSFVGDKAEEGFLLHEIGHVLGLVHTLDHGDGVHCHDPSCIMYPNIRFSFWKWITFQNPIARRNLCEGCRTDLLRAPQKYGTGKSRWMGPVLMRVEDGYCVASLPGTVMLWFGAPEKFDVQAHRDGVDVHSDLFDIIRHRNGVVTAWTVDPMYWDGKDLPKAVQNAQSDPWSIVRNIASEKEDRIIESALPERL